MLSIAHIINPYIVAETGEPSMIQLITFETMLIAKRFCAPGIEVTQLTTQNPGQRAVKPGCFKPTPDLERSVLETASFNVPRPLPLIKDILDRLYRNSNAPYLIYTNVDIALQPHFYWTVAYLIKQGYEAFAINRRTIPDHYERQEDLPFMYAEPGEKHKGWDCFIFHRSLYPRFELGETCIGTGWFGRVMLTNMACFARQFKVFEDLHLTFHIGNEKPWKTSQFEDYTEHNRAECKRILPEFDKKYGPFPRHQIPGRFLTLLEKESAP
jgi:hypothetical protein